MTNQQGAPEAPNGTAADGKTELFNVPGHPLMVRAVDFNRLHAENKHLAALVEAQQPAPSVAVALSDDLRDRLVAISEAIADQDDRAAQAMLREILAAPQPSPTPQADSQPAPVLPESLTLAVDRWFSENTGLGGCSDKDVSELAELFYGVAHAGGRESVDDALAIVESFGPGIGGLNDTYARQILLAEEVKRLRAARAPADSVTAPAAYSGNIEQELAMLIRRIVSSARRNCEDGSNVLKLANEAWAYLVRKGLNGSPLRDAGIESDPTPPAQAADSVLEDAETALRKVLGVVQRYLPPDGPSANDAMSEITEIVDPWPLGPLEKP